MRPLRQLLMLLVLAAVAVAVGVALFASVALVLAIIAPLLGLSYLAFQLRTAAALWRSHGRLPIADGVRVIAAGRARTLALLHLLAGAGGLALGAAPTLFVFGPPSSWVPVVLGGLLAVTASGAASQRVLAGGRSVDVLPPE